MMSPDISDPLEDLHKYVVNSRRRQISKAANLESSSDLSPNRYIFCNQCRGETKHICKAHYSRQYLTETEKYLGGYWFLVGYRLWMCAGCDSCTLEEYFTDDETVEEDQYSIRYFPERTEYHAEQKHFLHLPEKLDALYRETLHAFNYNLSVLCAAGLRSLIEGICAEKKLKGKNLKEKIDSLAEVLPQNLATNLHSFRFIGNTAIHELVSPDREDLRLAIEVCEGLLDFFYELDYKANRLNQSQKNKSEL